MLRLRTEVQYLKKKKQKKKSLITNGNKPCHDWIKS